MQLCYNNNNLGVPTRVHTIIKVNLYYHIHIVNKGGQREIVAHVQAHLYGETFGL